MKQILAIVMICISTNLLSQTHGDSITMKKSFGGYQFFQGPQRLKLNQLVNIMKPNELAYQQIKSAQSSYTLATIVGAVGGFMVGWPLGTALGGGDPNWAMAGIGAGLIVVSIPITQSFNRKAKQAVATYNGGLQASSFWNRSDLRMSLSASGVGLRLSFLISSVSR